MITSDGHKQSGHQDKEARVAGHTGFAEVNGKLIAFRRVGSGAPLLLCNRYWCYLDSWNHEFIQALAGRFTVITYDYSGLGLSSGSITFNQLELAHDIRNLAQALNFDKIIVGGWSSGGFPAQACAMTFPDMVSHLVLLGATPSGQKTSPGAERYDSSGKAATVTEEQIGCGTAEVMQLVSTAIRYNKQSEPSAEACFENDAELIDTTAAGTDSDDELKSDGIVREQLKLTKTPILVLSGDQDLISPVENWYSLLRELPTTQLIVLPQTGHRPHCQFPEKVAQYIDMFVQHAPLDTTKQA